MFRCASMHPVKHTWFDSHLIQVSLQTLTRTGPDDFCLSLCFQTRCIWPKPDQAILIRNRPVLHNMIWAFFYKKGTKSDVGSWIRHTSRPNSGCTLAVTAIIVRNQNTSKLDLAYLLAISDIYIYIYIYISYNTYKIFGIHKKLTNIRVTQWCHEILSQQHGEPGKLNAGRGFGWWCLSTVEPNDHHEDARCSK